MICYVFSIEVISPYSRKDKINFREVLFALGSFLRTLRIYISHNLQSLAKKIIPKPILEKCLRSLLTHKYAFICTKFNFLNVFLNSRVIIKIISIVNPV